MKAAGFRVNTGRVLPVFSGGGYDSAVDKKHRASLKSPARGRVEGLPMARNGSRCGDKKPVFYLVEMQIGRGKNVENPAFLGGIGVLLRAREGNAGSVQRSFFASGRNLGEDTTAALATDGRGGAGAARGAAVCRVRNYAGSFRRSFWRYHTRRPTGGGFFCLPAALRGEGVGALPYNLNSHRREKAWIGKTGPPAGCGGERASAIPDFFCLQQ